MKECTHRPAIKEIPAEVKEHADKFRVFKEEREKLRKLLE